MGIEKQRRPRLNKPVRGRPENQFSLRTKSLLQILEQHGYSPAAEIIKTAKLANLEYERCKEVYDAIQAKRAVKGMPPTQNEAASFLRIMGDCAKDIMPYAYPKLKSIEVNPLGGENLFKSFIDMVKQVADAERKAQDEKSD